MVKFLSVILVVCLIAFEFRNLYHTQKSNKFVPVFKMGNLTLVMKI